MTVSVVLSTYNGAKYIIEQLESIRKQNRKPDEVIIVDDCSIDNTYEIISDYIAVNNLVNWYLTRNFNNKGWRKNFIDALNMSSGDIVFPCDQDDIWMHDKIQKMEHIMEMNSNIEVLTSNYIKFFEKKNDVLGYPVSKQLIKQPFQNKIFNTLYPGCTYCIKKEMISKMVKYWEEGFPHDALAWRLANISGSLYLYNVPLIKWRRHSQSSYTIESIKSKTYISKYEWLLYAKRSIKMLMKYANDYVILDSDISKILMMNYDWIQKRIKFYKTRAWRDALRIVLRINCYNRLRQYFGDLYLVKWKR